jgi:hypothetical protein
MQENPVPGPEEKRESAVRHVCLRKPLPPGGGRTKAAGSMIGIFCAFSEKGAKSKENQTFCS